MAEEAAPAFQFDLGSYIFGKLDTSFTKILNTAADGMTNYIAPFIGVCVSLYFCFIALNWITSGKSTHDLPMGDLFKKMLYLALFTAFAFNIDGLYMKSIATPVQLLGGEISAAISKGSSTSSEVIDQMGQQIYDTITELWEAVPPLSITNLQLVPIARIVGCIIIVAIGGTIFTVICFLYLCIAKFMLILVLCLGPLYISSVFFPVTRNFFFLWLGQLFNYILLNALFGIAFAIITNLMQDIVSGANFSNILVGDAVQLQLIFLYVLFAGIMTSIPTLASALSGGVGINGLGGMTSAMNLVSAPARMAFQALKNMKMNGPSSPNQIGGGGGNKKLG